MKLPVTTTAALNDSEIIAITAFACELADIAGQAIVPHFRSSLDVDHKPGRGFFDPVTIADRAAEAAMREHIKARYPEHGILGEEYGFEEGSAGLTWVLDPIDGTRAFITGMPLWGTLIALYNGVEPVIGVMDQPVLGERYVGNEQHAVRIQNSATELLSTRDCRVLSDAVLMATSPEIFTAASEQLAFQSMVEACKMVRYGGDCYAYCMLASGYVDVVVESGLQPYDIQALIPIIQSAGGVVTDWHGNSAVNGGQVVAVGHRELLDQALELLVGCLES